MNEWRMPRESLEWVGPLTITVNGVVTTSYVVSVVPLRTRPTLWLPPDPLLSAYGMLIGPGGTWPLGTGVYQVWAKVTVTGETPVVDNAGTIYIT